MGSGEGEWGVAEGGRAEAYRTRESYLARQISASPYPDEEEGCGEWRNG